MEDTGIYMATNDDFFPKRIPKKFSPGCTQTIWKIFVLILCFIIFSVLFLFMTSLFKYIVEQNIGVDDEMRAWFARLDIIRWVLAGLFAFIIARFYAIVIPNPFGLATLILGSHRRVRRWGFNILIPLVEKRVTWVTFQAFPRQINVTKAVTRDGYEVIANANGMIGVNPENPVPAVFEVDNFVAVMDYLGATVVNNIVGDFNNDELGSDTVSEQLVTRVNKKVNKSGGRYTELSIADHPFVDEALSQISVLVKRAQLMAQAKIELAKGQLESMEIYRDAIERVAPDASPAIKFGAIERLNELDAARQISQGGGGPVGFYNAGRLGGFERDRGQTRELKDLLGKEEDIE